MYVLLYQGVSKSLHYNLDFVIFNFAVKVKVKKRNTVCLLVDCSFLKNIVCNCVCIQIESHVFQFVYHTLLQLCDYIFRKRTIQLLNYMTEYIPPHAEKKLSN